MSSPPPNIDQRSYHDLVRQTAELVMREVSKVSKVDQVWIPPGEIDLSVLQLSPEDLKSLVSSILVQHSLTVGEQTVSQGTILDQTLIDQIQKTKIIQVEHRKPDPGWALIRIFSHMAALVSNRLNQVPDKNFLAFLDLLGAQLQPPMPARVPLTFHLAEGSTSEAVVPAYTQVAAPPGQDTSGEVVFETEQKLVVTPAQLRAVYVKRPDRDSYQDCKAAATGTDQNHFSAFDSSTALEHYFYVACEEIFGFPGPKTATLKITSLQTEILKTLPVTWSYWNGETWNNFLIFIQGLNVKSGSDGGIVVASGKVCDRKQRILTASEISFPKSRFEQYKSSGESQKVSLTIFADPSANPPYSTPQFDTMLTSALLQDSTGVYADHVELARLSVDTNGTVTMLRSTNQAADVNNEWQIIFPGLPVPTACSLNHRAAQKWLRASFPSAAKKQLRQLEAAVQPDNIPETTEVEQIEGSMEIDSGALVPELCLFNSTPLDLSKDFYPFGEAPVLNDTFYLLLHEAFIKPDVTITLNTTINPPKLATGAVTITWEVGYGTVWEPIGSQWQAKPSPLNFIQPTTVTYRPEVSRLTQTTVNGQTGYWIRARITDGFYGIPPAIKKYVIFNEVGLVNAKEGPAGEFNAKILRKSTISETAATFENVASVDAKEGPDPGEFKVKVAGDIREFLQVGDQIRLFWYEATTEKTTEKVQEHQIKAIDSTTGKSLTITCSQAEGDAIQAGAKILRKSTISETTAPIYAPPSLQSLTLAYRFTLTEPAVYCAYNDFTYQYPFLARLKATAAKDQKQLMMVQVDGLVPGDAVVIRESAESNNRSSEPNVIEAIATETQQVRLKTPLKRNYAIGATVSRIFAPFTPMEDQDPTLYLGFSQPEALERQGIPPFANQPVTLYFEVELPPPGLLPDMINPETVISSVVANKLQIQVKDATGWRAGDRIQIQTDTYFIDKIDRTLITLTEPCKQEYQENDPVVRPKAARILWEYSSSTGWSRLSSVQDQTQTFFQRDILQLIGPADFTKQSHFGQQFYWLRARWIEGNFWVKPVLRRLLLNTTWAVQAMTLTNEVLGSSNGDRHQTFSVSHAPVLKGQQLEVLESSPPSDETGLIEDVWQRWQEVPDFYQSQATDRHYLLDRRTGQVQFGDGQSGMIPPRGTNNIRMTLYRTGGGIRGNQAAQTVTQLKTTVPYVDSVTNLEAAGGGAEQETLDQLKERVPKRLRHRDRAVTKQDFEDLAYAASTEVARVKVITPDEIAAREGAKLFDPLLGANWIDLTTRKLIQTGESPDLLPEAGQVKVIVVPHSSDRQPTPSLALLKQVETYLRECCQPGVNLIVTEPRWERVSITTEIVPVELGQADAVRHAVIQQLEAFLHPLSGRWGEGWMFGRYPHKSDLYALIQSVPGVDHVQKLSADPSFIAADSDSDQPESTQLAAQLTADYFIYSGSHTVILNGGEQ